jgi:phosphoglycolate phosphatase-like HAD superfamily hydrolase
MVDDVEGARAAGIRAVLLDRAAPATPAARVGATPAIASLSQLPGLVDELSGHPT